MSNGRTHLRPPSPLDIVFGTVDRGTLDHVGTADRSSVREGVVSPKVRSMDPSVDRGRLTSFAEYEGLTLYDSQVLGSFPVRTPTVSLKV